MENKYRTEKEGNMLRIIALKDFSDVKKGDWGGLIEKESNLSQTGDCWVYNNACVSGNASVSDNAKVYNNAWVYGDAEIYENAKITGKAKVSGHAKVSGKARVYGYAEISENAIVKGNVWICKEAKIFGNAQVSGHAGVQEFAEISGDAKISGNTMVGGHAQIHEDLKLWPAKTILPVSITTPINNEDCVILAVKREFHIISFSSNIKKEDIRYISIVEENYLTNIKTIRQLYGKEI